MNVQESVEIERLLGKATDESGLKESGPDVLEESLWSTLIYLQSDSKTRQMHDELSFYLQTEGHKRGAMKQNRLHEGRSVCIDINNSGRYVNSLMQVAKRDTALQQMVVLPH